MKFGECSRAAALTFCVVCAATAADRAVLAPAGAAKPVGPYSPGLAVGDFVYVSGQGVRDGDGKMPDGLEAQTAQCLANVRANLEAAGLDFRHVVAAQLYVADMGAIETVRRLWVKAFPPPGPAMVTLGVARMPTATTVEITVVAVRKLELMRRHPAGVSAGGRLYLDTVYGATRAEAEKKLESALKKNGHQRRDVVALSAFSTETAGPAAVSVNALPDGARWALFATASKERQSATVFCDVVQPEASGSVQTQTAEAFARLKSCLAAKGADLDQLVATNVYLDDIDDFASMNAVYASMFTSAFPTRTTIQPAPKSGGLFVRIAGVAVK